MSVFRGMAHDAGYRGDEAEQVAARLEDYFREQEEERMAEQAQREFDYDGAWRELPQDTREQAVAILRDFLPTSVQAEVGERIDADPDGWIGPLHMVWGMSVRNLLRDQGLKDADLPVTQAQRDYYGHGDDSGGAGWDDFYKQAVEAALGRREV